MTHMPDVVTKVTQNSMSFMNTASEVSRAQKQHQQHQGVGMGDTQYSDLGSSYKSGAVTGSQAVTDSTPSNVKVEQ